MARTIDFSSYIDERPDEGIYRVDRSIFTDPDLFELEMKYIFEKTWVFLCHESQIVNPNDFITTHIGRQPVIVNRDSSGNINAYINACAHRGLLVENCSRGNKKLFMCPFHGWCYKSSGELVHFGDSEQAGYSDTFDGGEMSLVKIGRVDSYGGFVFGSLSADAPELTDHLAASTPLIDMLTDQSDEGLEVLPGIQTYTFDGNWKLQAENGVDGYHVDTIHANYVKTIQRRRELLRGDDPVKAADVGGISKALGGYYDLDNGHVLLWSEFPNPEARPLYWKHKQLCEQYGELRAKWMDGYLRNLLLYPNVFLMDQMSTQIRVFRPVSVNKTEVTTYCFAPKGEPAESRSTRVRQYEDFFNASGMATPDDLAAFNQSQRGFEGSNARWSDMSRGAANFIPGPDQYAEELGLSPLGSGSQLEDEGIIVTQHRRWLHLMEQGQQQEEGV
ncbi:benzoate 1,2-dioxygenase large subunit [Halieaceae bacterium IMCC8485]|uniref:Benzoate 1,2-dioxygenase large subunit n=1 Tax=Candidatus Seongchinamella marina TaxID=2518990 RepID=A0ABT3T0S2_9GAMM|nr:SRPBCC family protein [Candidatus Seongchinamella marina]MCX2975470.1 benzoate 1,2-dioxygenase large subunit [Candidatus Seongchinamella marina]